MKPLTQKQELFCMAYIETGNASESYRRAYNTDKMKPESINRKAKELMDNVNISARIDALREPIRERHNMTVDDLLRELEEARQLALSVESPAPAVSATMGKAKILGLDKQVIDHTSSDGSFGAKELNITVVGKEDE